MLVLIDLTKLYFAVKDLRVHVDYKSLVNFVKEEYEEVDEEDIRFEAYTMYNGNNVGQVKFIENLESLGMKVVRQPFGKNANFSIDIAARAMEEESKEILVISNDPDLSRLFPILRRGDKQPTLCFFSERLGEGFYPEIIAGDVEFIDLSHPEIKHQITGRGDLLTMEQR